METAPKTEIGEKLWMDTGLDYLDYIQNFQAEINMINEYFNPRTKRFEFGVIGIVDADTFMEICRAEYLIDVFTVQHMDGQTIGFSRRI